MPVTLCVHRRQCCSGEMIRAKEVDLELTSVFVLRQVLDGVGLGESGIVDDHVEPPEARRRFLHGRPCRRRVGDVERCDAEVVTRREEREVLGRASRGDELLPRLEQGLGDHTPEPT